MDHERNPPKVWKKLGNFMHQDYNILYPNFWSGVEEFWESISSSEKGSLVEFLQYVNRRELPGGMQKKYWRLSGAQILPSKVKPFLSELLAKFESLHNDQSQSHT